MKTIPLTQGKVALVDDEDYERINAHKWYFNQGYAVRNKQRPIRGVILMHREILGLESGQADHRNMDTLDNRRCNLRPATNAQNQANQPADKRNTSGYKGVSWITAKKKWRAHITVNGKYLFLGYFDNAEEAGRAYADAAKQHWGEFARVSVP